jgi:ABC-type enterobactin transport system permease subunit
MAIGAMSLGFTCFMVMKAVPVSFILLDDFKFPVKIANEIDVGLVQAALISGLVLLPMT